MYLDKNLIDYGITWGKVLENIGSWNKVDFIWRFGLPAWEREYKRCEQSISIPSPAERVKRDPDRSSNSTQQIQSHQQKCVGNTLQTDSTEGQTDYI